MCSNNESISIPSECHTNLPDDKLQLKGLVGWIHRYLKREKQESWSELLLPWKPSPLTHIPTEEFSQGQAPLKASPTLQHIELRAPHYRDFTFSRKNSGILCFHKRKQSEKRFMWGQIVTTDFQEPKPDLLSPRQTFNPLNWRLKTQEQVRFLNGQPWKYQLSPVQFSMEAVLPTGVEFTTRFILSHAHPPCHCVLADTGMSHDEENGR